MVALGTGPNQLLLFLKKQKVNLQLYNDFVGKKLLKFVQNELFVTHAYHIKLFITFETP